MGGRGVDDSTPSLFPGQGPTRVTTDLTFLVSVGCQGLRSSEVHLGTV